MQQIKENNSSILIISNGNYQWLGQCMNGSQIISNLKSVQKLKKAINDQDIPIKLISDKSEFGETEKRLKTRTNSTPMAGLKNYNCHYKARKGKHRLSIIRKQTAFVKYLNDIKSKYDHETDVFCVYSIGDDDSEFEASKISMNIVFGDKLYPQKKNKDNPYLLVRHKLDIDRENAKTALQSILINVDSFHSWDKEIIIDIILQINLVKSCVYIC